MNGGQMNRDLGEGMRRVRLSEWARTEGIARITAYRMLQRGILPVPVERSPTGRWYVLLPQKHSRRTALYARATPGPEQALVINDQIITLSDWADSRQKQLHVVVKEVASPFVDRLQKLSQLLADDQITEILILRPSVIGRQQFHLIVAALASQGRTITAANGDDRGNRVNRAEMRSGVIQLCKDLYGPEQGMAAARRALA